MVVVSLCVVFTFVLPKQWRHRSFEKFAVKDMFSIQKQGRIWQNTLEAQRKLYFMQVNVANWQFQAHWQIVFHLFQDSIRRVFIFSAWRTWTAPCSEKQVEWWWMDYCLNQRDLEKKPEKRELWESKRTRRNKAARIVRKIIDVLLNMLLFHSFSCPSMLEEESVTRE